MATNNCYHVLKQQLIANTTYVSMVMSEPIAAEGNAAYASFLVTTLTGTSPQLTLRLDGSYNGGKTWRDATGTTSIIPGNVTLNWNPNSFPLLRLRVSIGGTSAQAILDGWIAFVNR